MANVTGVRHTSNIAQSRRVVDMADKITMLDPEVAPFLTMVKRIKGGGNTRVVHSPKFEWLEDDYLGTRTTLATAISAATTTSVSVADGSILRPYDVIHIPSVGENMLVTAVSGNTVTVTRGYGNTAAATAIAANAEVLNIGSAMAENALARDRRSTQEVAKFNYTQIFRTPVELSNTEAASKLYGGKDRAYQRRKAAAEHKLDIARSMYFGQRKEDTTGAATRRTMGGLIEFVKGGSNVQAFSSAGTQLTYKNFNTLVAAPAFKHGSTEKLLVCGSTLASAIDLWAIDKLVTKTSEEIFGVRVDTLKTSFGDLKILRDKLLEGDTYGGYGLILDMDKIRYAYLEGRDTKLNVDIQANDQDGVMDEYITECSLEVKCPDAHMLITGAYV